MAKRRTTEERLADAERELHEAKSLHQMKELAQLPLGQLYLQGMRKLRRASKTDGDPTLAEGARDAYERLAKVLEKRYGIIQPRDEEESEDESGLPLEGQEIPAA